MVSSSFETGSGNPELPLSPRETEVLGMTSRGMTNREIAQGMQVTVHTVKFHLAAIYRKLGVTNRTEAAVLYHAAGSWPTRVSDAS
jgi:DNA-binding CsgD family transcriptional regulator